MKSLRIGAAALAVALGLAASQAGAEPLLTVNVELAPGQSAQVGPYEGNVVLNVWAYIAGANGSMSDDGVITLSGKLASGSGGLLGDLSFALDASAMAADGVHAGFNYPPANAGTRQDLDGDGDLDIGGKDGNLHDSTNGYWIMACSFPTTYIPTTDGNRLLVGTVIYTLTDPDPVYGESTTINWSYRIRKVGYGGSMRFDYFGVDGMLHAVVGDSNDIGTGPDVVIASGEGVTISVIPEPAAMLLLALGGVFLGWRRRACAGP